MEEVKEEWKSYTYGNLDYLVSNFGRVIGCARNKELKTRLNEDGYLMVTLGDMQHRSAKFVHLIVAELFVENDDPINKVEVNHIDTDRQNPKFYNLEWCTHYDNVQHSVKLGNYAKPYYKGENNPNYGNDTLKRKYAENPELSKKNNSRPKGQNGRAVRIAMYDINMNEIKRFEYIGELCQWLIDNQYTKRNTTNVEHLRTTITPYIKNAKLYMNKFYFKKL